MADVEIQLKGVRKVYGKEKRLLRPSKVLILKYRKASTLL